MSMSRLKDAFDGFQELGNRFSQLSDSRGHYFPFSICSAVCTYLLGYRFLSFIALILLLSRLGRRLTFFPSGNCGIPGVN